ncbi:hypothetical protein Zmor_015810 [Zophobas morio]|uniref:Uncharacterized protein n=1 Tax=Zophobas morio TaxID=2755281 RepID=A0AA38IK50_9CUCU|nr:hypothetical protein Zmor_015810 [Zophobas morio]
MKTKLGWTLMGKVATPPPDAQKSCNIVAPSLLLTTPKLKDLWTLDVLGIENPEERKSNQEHEQQILDNNFQNTVPRQPNGRYKVSLPWIQGHKPLHDNLNLAKKRLNNLMNKLEKDGYYNEYYQVVRFFLVGGSELFKRRETILATTKLQN